jgi:hypothetical protein
MFSSLIINDVLIWHLYAFLVGMSIQTFWSFIYCIVCFLIVFCVIFYILNTSALLKTLLSDIVSKLRVCLFIFLNHIFGRAAVFNFKEVQIICFFIYGLWYSCHMLEILFELMVMKIRVFSPMFSYFFKFRIH